MKKRLTLSVLFVLLLSLVYLGCSKDDDPVLFNLSVTISPIGSGIVSPASGLFADGESITLTATPNQGYLFSNWSGNASGNTNPLQITITKNTTITAQFGTIDTDGDGVPDIADFCPDTPPGEAINQFGCSALQIDMDNDGVANEADLCPDTPAGEVVNIDGCADSQLDTDLDGVIDSLDECPASPPGTNVDEHGCPVGSTYTFIPDDEFEKILIYQGYDTVLNDLVPTAAIDTITQLSLPYPGAYIEDGIEDFTGIEGFASLEELGIFHQNFTGDALDLSQNLNLKTLSISCSFVDNLDLSQTTIETLNIGGVGIWFGPCDNKMSNLDLSGVPTLKALYISNGVFDDLNATLNSASSLEEVRISSPQTDTGPLDYLDLSANSNLKMVSLSAIITIGPNIVNLKNGANQQLEVFSLTIAQFHPSVVDWETCVEADDPAYIESILTSEFGPLPTYSITTDCGL